MKGVSTELLHTCFLISKLSFSIQFKCLNSAFHHFHFSVKTSQSLLHKALIISVFINISVQTTTLSMPLTLWCPLYRKVMCLCESYLPSRECLNEVSQCLRVALKESGWLDSYLFAFSFFFPSDSGSDWSQFTAAGLVGKKWVRRKFLQTWLESYWLFVSLCLLFVFLHCLFYLLICLFVVQDRSGLSTFDRNVCFLIQHHIVDCACGLLILENWSFKWGAAWWAKLFLCYHDLSFEASGPSPVLKNSTMKQTIGDL